MGSRPRLVTLAAERPDDAVGETEGHLNVQVDAVREQVGAREDVLRLVRDEPEPEPEQVHELPMEVAPSRVDPRPGRRLGLYGEATDVERAVAGAPRRRDR